MLVLQQSGYRLHERAFLRGREGQRETHREKAPGSGGRDHKDASTGWGDTTGGQQHVARRRAWETLSLEPPGGPALADTLILDFCPPEPGGNTFLLLLAALSFSKGSSQPRDRTQVSCIAGRFFTV